MEQHKRPPATVLFIFGGSGDLNLRKLTPALYNLFLDQWMPEKFAIAGLGRTPYSNDDFHARLLDGITKFSRRKDAENGHYKEFSANVQYLTLDAEKEEDFQKITDLVKQKATEWGEEPNVIFYLAVAPQLVPDIATKLGKLTLTKEKSNTRIVVEKPFGHDLKSAHDLNALLASMFTEEQIYRIDHYLGKETVQNILALRFANAMFEPVWNNHYIESVQITAAETVGLEGRAGYYDQSGALRDMVQNHLLQLLCMVAMEAPVSFDANEVRNKKVDVLHAIRPIKPEEVDTYAVRGQYGPGVVKGKEVPGYREEKGVAPESGTPTYAAVQFMIDNWRWQGVPFYVRSGKFLKQKTTAVTLTFKEAPQFAFPPESTKTWRRNQLTINIQPEMDIRLRFQSKRPGQTMTLDPVNMIFNYDEAYGRDDAPEAYETLLLDVMEGDATLFMRADQVEAAWKVVMPIQEHWENTKPEFPNYAPDSWGPDAAEKLVNKDGHNWVVTSPAKA